MNFPSLIKEGTWLKDNILVWTDINNNIFITYCDYMISYFIDKPTGKKIDFFQILVSQNSYALCVFGFRNNIETVRINII